MALFDEYLHTEAFAGFMLECRDQFEELCREIDAGNVPAGSAAQIAVEISPKTVDRIRFDRLAAVAGGSDG